MTHTTTIVEILQEIVNFDPYIDMDKSHSLSESEKFLIGNNVHSSCKYTYY